MKEKEQKNETDPVLKEYETRYISTIKNPLVNNIRLDINMLKTSTPIF